MALTTATAPAAAGLLALAGLGTTALLTIDESASCATDGGPPALGVGCGTPHGKELCPDGDPLPAARAQATALVRIDLWNRGGTSETRVCAVDAGGAKRFDTTYTLNRGERMDVQIPLAADVHDVRAVIEDDRIGMRIDGLDLAACEEQVAAMALQVERKMLGRLEARLDGMACAERPTAPPPDEPERAGTVFGAILPDEPLSRDAVRATAIAAGATGLAAAAFAVLGRSHRFHWLLLGLFTRVTRSKALDHPLRAEAHALVQADPGIGPEEIRRTLALSHGQVAHHLRALERTGLVVHIQLGRSSHFYPPGTMSPAEMRRHAILLAPAARRLLDALQSDGDADITSLAQRSGWSVPYTSRVAARLRRAGLVDTRRVGRRLVLRRAHPGADAVTQGA